MKKRIENKTNIPLLSPRDVRLQIIALLLNQGVYMEDEIIQMLIRHMQRQKDIERNLQSSNKEDPHSYFAQNSANIQS